jgi:TonB family protein
MKINFVNQHFLPLSATIFFHAMLATWLMLPSDAIAINQQTILVSFVAPSSSDKKSENNSHKKTALNIEKENALKQKKNNENKLVTQKQTSGRADPNAIATKSAETDPVFDAEYLNNPAPSYPPAAKRRNIQGKVLLDVLVKTDGTPAKVAISRSSGSSILDEAAMDAVSQWRFIPAKRSGEVVQANVLVPVEFKII